MDIDTEDGNATAGPSRQRDVSSKFGDADEGNADDVVMGGDIPEGSYESSLASLEMELAFLRCLPFARPIGKHRHFRIIALQKLIQDMTGTTVPFVEIWDRLGEMYDLEELDGMASSSSSLPASPRSLSPLPFARPTYDYDSRDSSPAPSRRMMNANAVSGASTPPRLGRQRRRSVRGEGGSGSEVDTPERRKRQHRRGTMEAGKQGGASDDTSTKDSDVDHSSSESLSPPPPTPRRPSFAKKPTHERGSSSKRSRGGSPEEKIKSGRKRRRGESEGASDDSETPVASRESERNAYSKPKRTESVTPGPQGFTSPESTGIGYSNEPSPMRIPFPDYSSDRNPSVKPHKLDDAEKEEKPERGDKREKKDKIQKGVKDLDQVRPSPSANCVNARHFRVEFHLPLLSDLELSLIAELRPIELDELDAERGREDSRPSFLWSEVIEARGERKLQMSRVSRSIVRKAEPEDMTLDKADIWAKEHDADELVTEIAGTREDSVDLKPDIPQNIADKVGFHKVVDLERAAEPIGVDEAVLTGPGIIDVENDVAEDNPNSKVAPSTLRHRDFPQEMPDKAEGSDAYAEHRTAGNRTIYPPHSSQAYRPPASNLIDIPESPQEEQHHQPLFHHNHQPSALPFRPQQILPPPSRRSHTERFASLFSPPQPEQQRRGSGSLASLLNPRSPSPPNKYHYDSPTAGYGYESELASSTSQFYGDHTVPINTFPAMAPLEAGGQYSSLVSRHIKSPPVQPRRFSGTIVDREQRHSSDMPRDDSADSAGRRMSMDNPLPSSVTDENEILEGLAPAAESDDDLVLSPRRRSEKVLTDIGSETDEVTIAEQSRNLGRPRKRVRGRKRAVPASETSESVKSKADIEEEVVDDGHESEGSLSTHKVTIVQTSEDEDQPAPRQSRQRGVAGKRERERRDERRLAPSRSSQAGSITGSRSSNASPEKYRRSPLTSLGSPPSVADGSEDELAIKPLAKQRRPSAVDGFLADDGGPSRRASKDTSSGQDETSGTRTPRRKEEMPVEKGGKSAPRGIVRSRGGSTDPESAPVKKPRYGKGATSTTPATERSTRNHPAIADAPQTPMTRRSTVKSKKEDEQPSTRASGRLGDRQALGKKRT